MRTHPIGKTHEAIGDLDDVRLMGCSRPDRLPDTPQLIREYQARQEERYAQNHRQTQVTWGFLIVMAILGLMLFSFNAGIAKEQSRNIAPDVHR